MQLSSWSSPAGPHAEPVIDRQYSNPLGYATQGFLYTTNSRHLHHHFEQWQPGLDSTRAPEHQCAACAEVAHCISGSVLLAGNYGNALTLDWAAGDYKVDDRFGVRFGKVKTPTGLFNEIQDIDSFLYVGSAAGKRSTPSTIATPISRTTVEWYTERSFWSHKSGKIEYRAFGGKGSTPRRMAIFIAQAEAGFNLPNGH